ncbi:MAG TPA: hypothetical protein VGY91_12020 [Chthoniobacterales bacterium]|jgi:hypothetical protein|nr:hypothetical protein [Chthoniobacterales bacterium]
MRAPTIQAHFGFDKRNFPEIGAERGKSLRPPFHPVQVRQDWTWDPQLINCGDMPLLRKWLRLSVIVLIPTVLALAEQQPASDKPLSAEDLKSAVSIDALTVPTPGEFFAAIEKGAKPNWTSEYRPPISIRSADRAQMALNLGTLIADGYIAVEAQDSQQVKNIGKDVLALAKKLSISQTVLARGASITQFAENNAWAQLNEELEATQNEVKKALEENRDIDLITLVSVGGWIRGTEVVTGLVMQNYNADSAKLLRQPALVAFLKNKLALLPDRLGKDPLVQKLVGELNDIQRMVSFAPDHVPTVDEVKELNAASAKLTKEIGVSE